jgi:hypothetical protein
MIYFQVQHKIALGAKPSAAEARSNKERKTFRNYKNVFSSLFFWKKNIKSRGRDKYFGHARQTGVDRQTPQQPLDVRGSV